MPRVIKRRIAEAGLTYRSFVSRCFCCLQFLNDNNAVNIPSNIQCVVNSSKIKMPLPKPILECLPSEFLDFTFYGCSFDKCRICNLGKLLLEIANNFSLSHKVGQSANLLICRKAGVNYKRAFCKWRRFAEDFFRNYKSIS
jgi:hypothetical protein